MRGAKRGRHRFFRSAAIDVEIEQIFPRRVAAWSRLQLAEVDPELVEAGQQAVESAGLVRHRADERGLLPVARSLDPRGTWPFRAAPADQEKAGDVFLDGLDPLRRNGQSIEFGGAPAGDGGLIGPRVALHLAGGTGSVVDGNRIEALAHDEGLALGQRLRMRENALYLPAVRLRQDQQAVVNLQRHLSDHQGSVFEEQVIGLQDAAGLGVFHWNQGKIDRLVGDAMERVPQGAKGLRRRRWKGGVQGLLRVGARFPLIANGDLARDLETLIQNLQPRPRLIERQPRMATDPDGLAEFVIPQPVGVPDRPGLLDLAEELIEERALEAHHDDSRWVHPRGRPVIVDKMRADDRWQPATVEVERPRLAV